jgi:hypothetical protein
MLNGISGMIGNDKYYELGGIFRGMSEEDDIRHDEVKYLVFHCIDLVKKI